MRNSLGTAKIDFFGKPSQRTPPPLAIQSRIEIPIQRQVIQEPSNNNVILRIAFGIIIFSLLLLTLHIYSLWVYSPRPHSVSHENSNEKRATFDDDCGLGKENVAGRCIPVIMYPDSHNALLMLNTSNPCQDMYRYACGSFTDAHCKDGQTIDDMLNFAHLEATNNDQRYEIIMREIESTQWGSSLVGDFYLSCKSSYPKMLGGNTMQELLRRIASMTDNKDLAQTMGLLASYDIIIPFSYTRELNPLNTSQIIDCFVPDGTFAFTKDELYSQAHVSRIETHMINVGGYSDKRARAESKTVVDIERYLFELADEYREHVGDLVSYIVSGDYHRETVKLVSFRGWLERKSGFDLTKFLLMMNRPLPSFGTNEAVWVHIPDYFRNLDFNQFDTTEWIRYLSYCVIESSVVHELNPEDQMRGERYTFHHGYDPAHSLPWNRPKKFVHAASLTSLSDVSDECIDLCMDYLPIVIDSHYIAELPSNDIKIAKTIAENIRQAFMTSIGQYSPTNVFSVLTPEQRSTIQQKIYDLNIDIGFPSGWPPERSTLKIDRSLHISDNILEIRRFHVNAELLATTHSLRYMYDKSVTIPNAFYHTQTNSLVVNAGLMKPPVYSQDYGVISLYARFGFIVAHEIAHSIDPHGILFDSKGTVQPNWIGGTQLDSFYRQERMCFQTQRTVLEDMADIMGLHMSYKALQTHYTNEHLGDVASVDFFLDFSQLWCSCMTKKSIDYIELHGSHSLPWKRVNTACYHNDAFLSSHACPSSTKIQCKTPV